MNVLNRLIEQAKNPRGFVGSSMLCIINVAELYKIKYHMTKFKTKTDIEKLLKETGYSDVIFHEYRGSICIIARK